MMIFFHSKKYSSASASAFTSSSLSMLAIWLIFASLFVGPTRSQINHNPAFSSGSVDFNSRNGRFMASPSISQWNLQDVLPANYNNQQAPNVDGSPVDIEVSLALLAFHKVSESDQSFRTDVFLHMKWTDPRLVLPRSFAANGFSQKVNDKLILGSNWVSRLWIPSLNFRNARSSAIFSSITPAIYLTINNESQVFLAAKMSLDLNCNMDFSKYPFDTQRCHVEISSLSHPVELVNLHWGSFILTKNLYLPQFTVLREENPEETCVNKYNIGTFSCLRGRFQLVRNIGNYIISKYIPSFLIVLISFLSFWIPTTAYPARVGLVIGALLSLITQQYSSSLPVSYVYALSIWYMICITFVFMTLLQYSIAISELANKITVNSAKYVIGGIKDRRVASAGQLGQGGGGAGGGGGGCKADETPGRIRDANTNSANVTVNTTSDAAVVGESSYRKRDFCHLFHPNSRNNSMDMICRIVFPFSYLVATVVYIGTYYP